MIRCEPVVLEGHGVRLEPLRPEHADGLTEAAADGELWNLWYTSVPAPGEAAQYIATALEGEAAGHRLPWAVRELSTGRVIGTTSYHDIIPTALRVEIGYTWYAASWHRTHVNRTCKYLLMTHAFETLGCKVVGLRTDIANLRSQEAILALGAKRDGVIRHQMQRRDGSVRDTVMFSLLVSEWPPVRERLLKSIQR